jgi:hypothetical protein
MGDLIAFQPCEKQSFRRGTRRPIERAWIPAHAPWTLSASDAASRPPFRPSGICSRPPPRRKARTRCLRFFRRRRKWREAGGGWEADCLRLGSTPAVCHRFGSSGDPSCELRPSHASPSFKMLLGWPQSRLGSWRDVELSALRQESGYWIRRISTGPNLAESRTPEPERKQAAPLRLLRADQNGNQARVEVSQWKP